MNALIGSFLSLMPHICYVRKSCQFYLHNIYIQPNTSINTTLVWVNVIFDLGNCNYFTIDLFFSAYALPSYYNLFSVHWPEWSIWNVSQIMSFNYLISCDSSTFCSEWVIKIQFNWLFSVTILYIKISLSLHQSHWILTFS